MCQSRSLNGTGANARGAAWRRVVIFSPISLHHPWCPHTADLLQPSCLSHRQGPAGLTRPTLLARGPQAWQDPTPQPLIISVKSFPSPDSFLPLTLFKHSGACRACQGRLPASRHETKNVRILKVQGTCHLVCYHCYSLLAWALSLGPSLSSCPQFQHSDTCVRLPTSFTGHLVGFGDRKWREH